LIFLLSQNNFMTVPNDAIYTLKSAMYSCLLEKHNKTLLKFKCDYYDWTGYSTKHTLENMPAKSEG